MKFALLTRYTRYGAKTARRGIGKACGPRPSDSGLKLLVICGLPSLALSPVLKLQGTGSAKPALLAHFIRCGTKRPFSATISSI